MKQETSKFKVISITADEHPGNALIDPCVRFTVTLQAAGRTVTDYLFTDERTQWRTISFLKSVGVYRDGMTVREALLSLDRDLTGTAVFNLDSGLNAVSRYKTAGSL
ncbi:MAG: hypothetical protein IKG46_10560 [Solobacterium sp.]|nr:hypothetical protein [Oscillospiraceae bacterium]MBR3358249.1 hypothetical protein [Solobacterium sp.]